MVSLNRPNGIREINCFLRRVSLQNGNSLFTVAEAKLPKRELWHYLQLIYEKSLAVAVLITFNRYPNIAPSIPGQPSLSLPSAAEMPFAQHPYCVAIHVGGAASLLAEIKTILWVSTTIQLLEYKGYWRGFSILFSQYNSVANLSHVFANIPGKWKRYYVYRAVK